MLSRPRPAASLLDPENWGHHFEPAPEVEEWIRSQIISDTGALFNQDHQHLEHARIGVLWTVVPYRKQGKVVAGTAEIPHFLCSAWQKARQEQQMRNWFGCDDLKLPDFVITLDANLAEAASDTQFCALVEHELYHCGQAIDEFGQPRFSKDTGKPMFTIRGHDVEEFVGVVRRYGAGVAAGATAQLVETAKKDPTVSRLDVAIACGTCHLHAA